MISGCSWSGSRGTHRRPRAQIDAVASRRRRNLVVWPAAFVAAIAALAIWASTFELPHRIRRSHVLSLLPPHGSTFAIEEAPQVSPDGRRLAFVGHDAAGSRLLYLRALDAVAVAQSLERIPMVRRCHSGRPIADGSVSSHKES